MYNHGISQSNTQKGMFKIMNESLGIKETIILGVKISILNYFQISDLNMQILVAR